MTGVLIKKIGIWTQRQRHTGSWPVKTKAEIKATLRPAKEHLGLPKAGRKDLPLGTCEVWSCQHFDFRPLNLRTVRQ